MDCKDDHHGLPEFGSMPAQATRFASVYQLYKEAELRSEQQVAQDGPDT
jgi:hypothetical protein